MDNETEKPETALPEDLQIWRDEGRFEEIDGHKLFVHASGTAKKPGHGVLITHGFPGSSVDWKNVVPRVALHTRVVVSDFLGLGQSDKPTDGTFETHYSLFQKADRVVEIARREGLEEVVLVIHDMGQTVGAEIMARHEEGKLPFKIKHAIILNGSTLVDMVQFVPEQVAMLKAPDELTEGMSPETLKQFMAQDGLFSKEHLPCQALLDVMVAQICTKRGDRLLTRMNRYQLERKANLQRWRDGLTKLSAPTSVYWGEQDINAKVEMAHKMKELNPDIDLHIWKDCAHWPPIEVPERLAKAIIDRCCEGKGGRNQ
jgi:pimeloyl-ACP methyl ester carboxylesterase